MFQWLSDNKDWITTLTNIGTLLVWLFYAQLLYSGYRRQRRPRVLINRGVGGEGLDSPCLICNMSEEAVYVYFILVILETSEESIHVPVTDCEVDAMGDNTSALSARTRQGPVESGKYLELLSYRLLLERAARVGGIELKNSKPVNTDIELKAIEFHVVCIYGSDDDAFGAVRRFELTENDAGELTLTPESIDTTHRTSRRYKQQVRQWLKRYAT
ncbi:MAG: hypothetical protein WD623_04500 [Marinobacter sp.]|uniref:hypothetical protein n=1 Tax=Marinobacter sp. TaxID=50741 RepID=UPI0034A07EB0